MKKRGWIIIDKRGTPVKRVGSDTILIYNKRREAEFVTTQINMNCRFTGHKARMIEYEIQTLAMRPDLYKNELSSDAHLTRRPKGRNAKSVVTPGRKNYSEPRDGLDIQMSS